jgi:hypothetical protein
VTGSERNKHSLLMVHQPRDEHPEINDLQAAAMMLLPTATSPGYLVDHIKPVSLRRGGSTLQHAMADRSGSEGEVRMVEKGQPLTHIRIFSQEQRNQIT